jgi:hypothetical protein
MTARQAVALIFVIALCGPLGASAATAGIHGSAGKQGSEGKQGSAATVAKPKAVKPAKAAPPELLDPTVLGKAGADVVTIVRWLNDEGPGAGKYQLEVENTSGIGYIDSFNWNPPVGMTIVAVTSSEGGKCTVSNGSIECKGKIAPPTCTCTAGGSLTVNFTATGLTRTFADGYWTSYGIVGAYIQIESMTPVPYHIPSTQPSGFQDLPLCDKNQKSTANYPCAAAKG